MNADAKNSGSSSDATSHSGRHKASSHGADARAELTASEYIERQTAEAKTAIVNALNDVKRDLATAADPILWTKQHPWAAVGIATAAGFATAALVTPSPSQPANERLAMALEDLKEHLESRSGPSSKKPTDRGVLSMVLGPLVELGTAALHSVIAGANQQGGPAQSASHNGFDEDAHANTADASAASA